MRYLIALAGLTLLVVASCSAPVRISAFPGDEIASISKEECKLDYEKVRVLGSLPEEGTYVEIGYMNVKQESSSQLVTTSEEKQIEEARIQACQWGADAIVVMGGASDKGSDFWSGWKDRGETKVIAIKFK